MLGDHEAVGAAASGRKCGSSGGNLEEADDIWAPALLAIQEEDMAQYWEDLNIGRTSPGRG